MGKSLKAMRDKEFRATRGARHGGDKGVRSLTGTIPCHGLRTTDLPRESLRDIEACLPAQAATLEPTLYPV